MSLQFHLCLFFFFLSNLDKKKMGCCASVEESDSVGKLRNEEIDGQLRMEKLNNKNEVKLLLLGMYKCNVEYDDRRQKTHMQARRW